MGKVQCILITLSALGNVFCAQANEKVLSIHERAAAAPFDRQQACKNLYQASQDPQLYKQDENYGCIYYCSYISTLSSLFGSRARSRQTQADLSPCGTDGQCVHGKCFHTSCVQKCQRVLGSGKMLTDISKGGWLVSNRIYCRGDHSPFNNYYYKVTNSYECEMPNQTEPKPTLAPTTNPTPSPKPQTVPTPQPTPSPKPQTVPTPQPTTSPKPQTVPTPKPEPTIYLDPLTTCQQKYGGSNPSSITARIWANGCYFRCFRSGKKLPKKFLQPNGMTCADNYQCLHGKCESISCIKQCTNSSNGKVLKKIKQSSNTATCIYKGLFSARVTLSMPAGQMCEATYPPDEVPKTGPGREVNTTGTTTGSGGATTTTLGPVSSTDGSGPETSTTLSTVPLNPTQECKRIYANKTTKPITARNYNNKCFFRCYKGSTGVLRDHVQPNKMSCGTNYECLNGGCYSSKCINTCRQHMGDQPLRKLTQSGPAKTDLKCYTNDKILSVVTLAVTAADDCVHNTNNGVPDSV